MTTVPAAAEPFSPLGRPRRGRMMAAIDSRVHERARACAQVTTACLLYLFSAQLYTPKKENLKNTRYTTTRRSHRVCDF